MCLGFGAIVDKYLNIFWIEPDDEGDISHSDILSRLGWEDNKSQFVRNFVRVQCADWNSKNIQFDERETLPTWAEENQDEIFSKFDRIMQRVDPIKEIWKIKEDEYYRKWQEVFEDKEKEIQVLLERVKELDVLIRQLKTIAGYVPPQ